MGRRGAKSTAELVAVPSPKAPKTERIKPPAGKLNAAGKKRWAEIVGMHEADRFNVGDANLLADMILSEQYIAKCDRMISKLRSWITAEGKQHPLFSIRESHVRVQIATQRALRLCPSMRMRQEKKGLGGRGGKPQGKPWEKRGDRRA